MRASSSTISASTLALRARNVSPSMSPAKEIEEPILLHRQALQPLPDELGRVRAVALLIVDLGRCAYRV